MKKLGSFIAVVILFFGCLGCFGQQTLAVGLNDLTLQSSPILAVSLEAEGPLRNTADAKLGEYGGKIDLNNSHVRTFLKYPGFYPTLAGKIVKNAPYKSVEDVLQIPGLSETQKERLQANLDNFVVTDPYDVYNEGDDRFNPGIY